VYVSNWQGLTVYSGFVTIYPIGSNGNVAPTSVIGGANTQLSGAEGIVVDNSGEILVANRDTNSIVGFPVGASGNVAPNIVISGPNTGLASPNSLALDSAGNLYVANCGYGCNYGPPGPASIEVFPPGSTGNMAPIRTITGKKTQLQVHVNGIAVDSRGFIYVALAGPNVVNVYGRNASGNKAPVRVIAGADTLIESPMGIAVDDTGIYVASTGNNRLLRFARNADGDIAPKSVVAPNWSSSEQPLGDIIAAPGGTIHVTGFAVPVVAQYADKAKLHAAPITEISGPATQLGVPTAVFVR
jgi:hypothetical protein